MTDCYFVNWNVFYNLNLFFCGRSASTVRLARLETFLQVQLRFHVLMPRSQFMGPQSAIDHGIVLN